MTIQEIYLFEKAEKHLDDISKKLDIIADILKETHKIEKMGLEWESIESEDSRNAR